MVSHAIKIIEMTKIALTPYNKAIFSVSSLVSVYYIVTQDLFSFIYYAHHIIFFYHYLVTDIPFPKTFNTLCSKILTRLFRVFVHVYIHHFDRIVFLEAVSKKEKKIENYQNLHHQMFNIQNLFAEPFLNPWCKVFKCF